MNGDNVLLEKLTDKFNANKELKCNVSDGYDPKMIACWHGVDNCTMFGKIICKCEYSTCVGMEKHWVGMSPPNIVIREIENFGKKTAEDFLYIVKNHNLCIDKVGIDKHREQLLKIKEAIKKC